MSQNAASQERSVFTIGHSNHPLEHFIDLLRAHRVEALVDTRSAPYSKYTPHFNKENLKAAVTERGFKYLFLGMELGGRPEGAGYYDEDGRVDYALVAESAPFLKGIARVEKGLESYRVALLCAEENPEGCHRRLLVGRVFGQRGVMVLHIRGDGSVQTEAEVDPPQDEQLALFGASEAPEWKSIQSVLPRERRPGSSER